MEPNPLKKALIWARGWLTRRYFETKWMYVNRSEPVTGILEPFGFKSVVIVFVLPLGRLSEDVIVKLSAKSVSTFPV